MLLPNIDVFIDGGGNDRILMEKYLAKLHPFHKVYVFEPNPLFYNSYNNSNLILIKKAIWISNGKLPFYLSTDPRQVGSSLLQEKLCKVNNKLVKDWTKDPIEVDCVDFSEWIRNNIKPYYNLTLKLDIEGAEYKVLWKMIKDGTISFIKKLFVEFHTEHLGEEHHDLLIAALEKHGITPHFWD